MGNKLWQFLLGTGLLFGLLFAVHSQAQKLGEDVGLPLPQIPAVDQIEGIKFISPNKTSQEQVTPRTQTVRRLPTVGELIQKAGQGIKNFVIGFIDLIKPDKEQTVLVEPTPGSSQDQRSSDDQNIDIAPTSPEPISIVTLRQAQGETRVVIQKDPELTSKLASLETLIKSLEDQNKALKAQDASFVQTIAQIGRINNLGVQNDPNFLTISSPTISSPTYTGTGSGALGTTGNISAGGDLSVTGNAAITGTLTVGSGTITVNGDANQIFTATGTLLFQPSGDTKVGIGTTTPGLNAGFGVATSTFISGNLTVGGVVIDADGGISGGGTTTLTNLTVTNVSTSSFAGFLSVGTTTLSGSLILANFTADPSIAADGQLYYSKPDNAFRAFTNGAWGVLGGASGFTDDGANVRLSVQSDQVGIGTSTPTAAKLHITSTTSPQLVLTDFNGGTDLKHVYASSSAGALALGRLNDALSTYTEYLRIATSGNVGIGTTSPYAKLSVVGQTVSEYFTATSTTATSTFLGAVGVGTSTPAEQLSVANRLYVGGSGTSTIENNLQVRNALQIGTDSTSTYIDSTNLRMTVAGTSGGVPLITLNNTTNAVGAQVGIAFENDCCAGSSRIMGNLESGGGTAGLSFYTGGASPSEALRIRGEGPVEKLVSDTNTAISGYGHINLLIGNTNTTNNNYATIAWSDNGYGSTDSVTAEFGLQHTDHAANLGDFVWALRLDGNNFPERMRLTNAGNLGIGTTSPYAKLSVAGVSGIVAQHFVATSTTATSTFEGPIAAGINGLGRLTLRGATSTSSILIGGENFNTLYIGSTTPTTALNGFNVSTTSYFGFGVGIGTTSPSQLFSVAGNTYITGGLGIGSGTTTAGGLTVTGPAELLGGLLVTGASSTITNLNATTLTLTNATSTNATTTTLYVSGALQVAAASSTITNLITSQATTTYFAATTLASTTVLVANTSLGVGTSTPAEQLSVANRLYVGGTGTSTIENNLIVRGTFQAGTASSFLSDAGLNTTGTLVVTGAGTSTFSGGITAGGLASSEGLTLTGGSLLANGFSGLFGSLSIATTTPAFTVPFAVQGDAYFSGNLLNVANLTATGTATIYSGLLVTGATSTITNLVTVNATSTSATTTALYISGPLIVNGASSSIANLNLTSLNITSGTTTNATSTSMYISGPLLVNGSTTTINSVVRLTGPDSGLGELRILGATSTSKIVLGNTDSSYIFIGTTTPSIGLQGFNVATTSYFANSVGIGTTTITTLGSAARGLAVSGSLYVSGSSTVSELTLSGEALNVSMGSSTPRANTLYKENIVKGWVIFNGTAATPNDAIVGAFNVSSITDNGTGDYTVNWNIASSNSKYATVVTANAVHAFTNGLTNNSSRVRLNDTGDVATDAADVSVFIIGNQ